MKNLIAIALLFSSFSTYAQFESGDMAVGGTVQFVTSRPDSDERNKSTIFQMNPTFGVFVSQNLELGARVGYSSHSTKRGSTPGNFLESNSEGLGMGLYAQRYFKITDKFLFSVTASASYDIENSRSAFTDNASNNVFESDTKFNSISVAINPNFVFFPSPRWAFRASFGHISYRSSNNRTNDEGENVISFNYGLVGLGIAYFLKRGNP